MLTLGRRGYWFVCLLRKRNPRCSRTFSSVEWGVIFKRPCLCITPSASIIVICLFFLHTSRKTPARRWDLLPLKDLHSLLSACCLALLVDTGGLVGPTIQAFRSDRQSHLQH